jgi:Uma2 family endonuclease
MGMPVQDVSTRWTAEMARDLPDDGKRYEVLDGELFVTPSPTWDHQTILDLFHASLRPYVREHRLGWLRWSPADIEFSPTRLVQPDLFVVRQRPEGMPRSWTEVKSLLLAVEALSPSTAATDRVKKRLIYQDEGVGEYWIVDAQARLVERWRPGDTRPAIIAGALEWQPREGLESLRIDLPALFDEVAGHG